MESVCTFRINRAVNLEEMRENSSKHQLTRYFVTGKRR